jgi:hypothetical protein
MFARKATAMTSSARLPDTNRKPPPPPGLPTIDQRIKAMQLAAKSHSGFLPTTGNGNGAPAVKLVLPPELPTPSTPAGKIPATIRISVPPEIHYYNDNDDREYEDDEDNDDDSLSLASNSDVFRNGDDESMNDNSSRECNGSDTRPCIERQRAFPFFGSKDSSDERLYSELHAQSVMKPSRLRFMRGFKASLFPTKDDPQGK